MSEGWDRTVHTHLMALAVSPVETLWAKDSLFRYWSTSSTGQWSPAGTGHLQCVKTVKVIFGGSPVNYVNTKFVKSSEAENMKPFILLKVLFVVIVFVCIYI